MLTGRFGETTGRPYLEGRVIVPRFGIDADVSFLVDTGADTSLLSSTDAFDMGIDYSLLTGETESVGTAGVATNFTEPASLVFIDPGNYVYVYHVDLEIASPNPDLMYIPSLLGREVIDRWRMVYDRPKSTLSFTVRSADLTLRI